MHRLLQSLDTGIEKYAGPKAGAFMPGAPGRLGLGRQTAGQQRTFASEKISGNRIEPPGPELRPRLIKEIFFLIAD
jgi:hypothetical protein